MDESCAIKDKARHALDLFCELYGTDNLDCLIITDEEYEKMFFYKNIDSPGNNHPDKDPTQPIITCENAMMYNKDYEEYPIDISDIPVPIEDINKHLLLDLEKISLKNNNQSCPKIAVSDILAEALSIYYNMLIDLKIMEKKKKQEDEMMQVIQYGGICVTPDEGYIITHIQENKDLIIGHSISLMYNDEDLFRECINIGKAWVLTNMLLSTGFTS